MKIKLIALILISFVFLADSKDKPKNTKATKDKKPINDDSYSLFYYLILKYDEGSWI
jgi:hypothetical protein